MNNAKIKHAKSEVAYWENRCDCPSSIYSKWRTMSADLKAKTIRSDANGLAMAKIHLANMQAAKCRADSIKCVKALWG